MHKDLFVLIDLMFSQDNKRFVLRVWRKTSNEILQARLLPNPMEDVIVGFVAIDLTVLMAGMPSITGWFNVVDYSSRINGQIKVCIWLYRCLVDSVFIDFLPFLLDWHSTERRRQEVSTVIIGNSNMRRSN